MSIRFKKYKFKVGGNRFVKAIRITDNNMEDIVDFIGRHNGEAVGNYGPPVKIRVRQRNYGETWGKKDWRVATVGDFIVRHDRLDLEHPVFDKIEFERIKEDAFEDTFELVK